MLGRDARIGAAGFQPGLGFGGGCLPKDIRAFRHRAEELGAGSALAFLAEVDSINLRCQSRAVQAARQLAGDSLCGQAVGVLGTAFKPGSDDIRESPALEVAVALCGLGAGSPCTTRPQPPKPSLRTRSYSERIRLRPPHATRTCCSC